MAAEVAVRQMKIFLREARKRRYEIEVDLEKANDYTGVRTPSPVNPFASNLFSGKTSSLELGQNVRDMSSFLELAEPNSSKHDKKRASLLKFINRFQANENEE